MATASRAAVPARSVIRFACHPEQWSTREQALALVSTHGAKRVLDVGGGANPTLTADDVRAHELDYVVLDVSADELAKAGPAYRTVVGDVLDPSLPERVGQFDLILSRTVAEHVPDPKGFHRAVRELLAPQGVAFHFFPTLYSLPFVVNRLLPESFSEWLVTTIWPERSSEGDHGKFPAFYRWCRGPSPRQLERLESLGYTVEEYVGFFGHGYYARVGALGAAPFLARLMKRLRLRALTSYAWLTVRRNG